MSAALCALSEVIELDSKPFKNLIPSFVSILKQTYEHKLPKTYDYHRMPAPFIQVDSLTSSEVPVRDPGHGFTGIQL
jgi:AP-4 complex subunit epsilon-1